MEADCGEGLGRCVMNDPFKPIYDDGGAAFPGGNGSFAQGMTLRDYFAAKAMASIIADPNCMISADKIAREAYAQADAMIAVRASS